MPTVQFGPYPFDADLIIFDKDGTLLDFTATWRPKFLDGIERLLRRLPDQANLYQAIYHTLGYDPESGRFDVHGPFATASSEAITFALATVLYQTQQPRLAWDACEQRVRQEFAPVFTQALDLTPVTDLPALFSSLHENALALAVITSDDRGPTQATLAHFGLEQFVGYIACADDPVASKPAPDAILAACQQFGVSVERSVMVGDTPTDLEAGRAAGVGLRVGVLTGTGTREDLAPLAHVVLDSIGEIQPGNQ